MKSIARIVVILLALHLPVSAWAGDVTTQWAQTMCNLNVCAPGKSIACFFTQSVQPLCAATIQPLTDEWRKAWVDAHNNVRASVTNASPMPELVWSDDLAKMAILNVSRCKFEHDECRNTLDFSNPGQNLSLYQTTGTTRESIPTLVSRVVKSWADERRDPTCVSSNINPYTSKHKCSHYTQIVKRGSTKIGCAAASYVQNGFNTVYVVCNYSRTNMVNENTY